MNRDLCLGHGVNGGNYYHIIYLTANGSNGAGNFVESFYRFEMMVYKFK